MFANLKTYGLRLLKTVQTITTFRNPLADPMGTRRGPQFENRWATLPFNLSLIACFAAINVSQSSVATHARCGRIFNIHLTTHLPRNLPMKKIKSVKIRQNYGHESVAHILAHPVVPWIVIIPPLHHIISPRHCTHQMLLLHVIQSRDPLMDAGSVRVCTRHFRSPDLDYYNSLQLVHRSFAMSCHRLLSIFWTALTLASILACVCVMTIARSLMLFAVWIRLVRGPSSLPLWRRHAKKGFTFNS